MEWDSYSYKIAEHYLSALINGDHSGMSDAESAEFTEWEQSAHANARAAGFTVGHWSTDSEYCEDFGRCAVSGMLANRADIRLMVYRT